MTTVNPMSLTKLLSSGYIEEEPQRSIGSRNIHRYLLTDCTSYEAVASAADSVMSLVQDNPELIATFPISPRQSLEEQVSTSPYLVINGRAVCLSDKAKAPDNIDLLCTDIFFSESLLSEPIQCEQGQHVFEKKYIEVWKRNVGERCPGSINPHNIGIIEVDPVLSERVQRLTRAVEDQTRAFQDVSEGMERQNILSRVQGLRLSALEGKRKHEALKVGSGAAKISVKLGIVGAAKVSGKTTAQICGKKVPFLSVLFGVVLAYSRYQNGESKEAALEIASGLAACVPGYGTATSIAIDAGLFLQDISKIYNGSEVNEKGEITLNISIDEAHESLGLDPKKAVTKEEIDSAFRDLSKKCHPDKLKEDGRIREEESVQIQQLLPACKDILYKHYGY